MEFVKVTEQLYRTASGKPVVFKTPKLYTEHGLRWIADLPLIDILPSKDFVVQATDFANEWNTHFDLDPTTDIFTDLLYLVNDDMGRTRIHIKIDPEMVKRMPAFSNCFVSMKIEFWGQYVDKNNTNPNHMCLWNFVDIAIHE